MALSTSPTKPLCPFSSWMSSPLGLYLHIPFCLSKCRYCDFFSGRATGEQMEAYVLGLEARIAALEGLEFSSVYFGGGTPTAILPDRLCRLLSRVKLAPGAEVSFEANPATVNGDDLIRLLQGGFNRISVGVQSFSEGELTALGRIHTADQAKKTVLDAQNAGFDRVSLDLMLGIPGQTKESALFSVEQALSLGVGHVSAYCLKLEPGTPMYAQYPDGRGLPDEDETADIYLSVVSALEAGGLGQYEISNFARAGQECRHNLLYWELGDYIGLGPSAHSFYRGQRFEFPRSADFTAGFENVFSGAVSEETDVQTEYIMLSLRTARGISRERLSPRAQKKLETYAAHGFARVTPEGFALTPRGFLVSTHIISDILF